MKSAPPRRETPHKRGESSRRYSRTSANAPIKRAACSSPVNILVLIMAKITRSVNVSAKTRRLSSARRGANGLLRKCAVNTHGTIEAIITRNKSSLVCSKLGVACRAPEKLRRRKLIKWRRDIWRLSIMRLARSDITAARIDSGIVNSSWRVSPSIKPALYEKLSCEACIGPARRRARASPPSAASMAAPPAACRSGNRRSSIVSAIELCPGIASSKAYVGRCEGLVIEISARRNRHRICGLSARR